MTIAPNETGGVLIAALFTEREFAAVRHCCRDADATAPLRAFDAAVTRAEGVERQAMAVAFATGAPAGALPPATPVPDTDPAPAPEPPPSEPPAPSLRVPLPPAPKATK